MRRLLPVLLALGCASTPEPAVEFTRAQLLDPQTCKACHAEQHLDWSGSMHAHAADDPVFRAMNARGQRETAGKLGNFCTQCHAPMAVRDGLTKDGTNLDQLPAGYKGVTCYFCHTVASVDGAHNAAYTLGDPLTMRGALADPMPTTGHRSAYAGHLDRDRLESSQFCGSCHDVVTPAGVHIDRTFKEWLSSVYNHTPGGTTCGQCHMPQSAQLRPAAQVKGAPLRRVHGHLTPAIDVAGPGHPRRATQIAAVQKLLDTSLQSAVCVGPGRIRVILDNVAAGHGFPSGAAHNRRVWVEVKAWHKGALIYQSGVDVPGDPTATADPDLWLMRDCMLGKDQQQVHMFWEALSYVSAALGPALTFNPADPRFYQTHVMAPYPATGTLPAQPDKVTVRVRLHAIGRDVLDDLVASGDLDPAVRDHMVDWQVGDTLEWTPATGKPLLKDGLPWSCWSLSNLDASADTVPALRRCDTPTPKAP
jgi:hypothetical protein